MTLSTLSLGNHGTIAYSHHGRFLVSTVLPCIRIPLESSLWSVWHFVCRIRRPQDSSHVSQNLNFLKGLCSKLCFATIIRLSQGYIRSLDYGSYFFDHLQGYLFLGKIHGPPTVGENVCGVLRVLVPGCS